MTVYWDSGADIIPGDIVRNKTACVLYSGRHRHEMGSDRIDVYAINTGIMAFVVATVDRDALLLVRGALLWADRWEWEPSVGFRARFLAS